jgi:proliferating cell nuclear antigen
MFKAVINAEVFKDAIETVSTLVDEAKFRLTKDGMTARAVDPANVAMVAFSLNAKAFETFEATDVEIGVDLTRLMDILGMASKEDKIELSLNEETRKMEIRTCTLAYTLS